MALSWNGECTPGPRVRVNLYAAVGRAPLKVKIRRRSGGRDVVVWLKVVRPSVRHSRYRASLWPYETRSITRIIPFTDRTAVAVERLRSWYRIPPIIIIIIIGYECTVTTWHEKCNHPPFRRLKFPFGTGNSASPYPLPPETMNRHPRAWGEAFDSLNYSSDSFESVAPN